MTNGMKSSEFWLVLILIVGTFVLIGIGKLTPDQLVGLVTTALGVGGYAIGRGIAKSKTNGNVVKPE